MQTSLLLDYSDKKEIDWQLPNLSGQKKLFVDTEGTGLRVASGKDRAVGLSVSTVWGNAWYIPWGHKEGFNFELDKVKLWINDNLAGKELVFCNAKHDVNALYNCGVDLEALNCFVRDVAYMEGLTVSKRTSHRLEDLAEKYSPTKRKIHLPFPANEIWQRPASHSYDYACMDAAVLSDIETSIAKTIKDERLDTVRDLEDSLIYVVCHMERNGSYIDVSKLEEWGRRADQRMSEIFWQLSRSAGFRVEPGNATSVAKLAASRGIKIPSLNSGKPSITNEFLLKSKDPFLRLVFDWRKLADLKSDYLDKYPLCLTEDNRILYNLNQLKSDEYGAVTGRFSSSGSKHPDDDKKINVQQVVKMLDEDEDKDHEDDAIRDFAIRDLFIPEPGCSWVSADANSLQFRIFAHYSEDRRLIRAYNENPSTDFHKFVAEEILGGRLSRGQAKHENFGNLFGMGVDKGARRLGVSVEEYKEIKRIYNEAFPAAKRLSYKAQGLARHPSLGPHPFTNDIGRGYIRTISRRRRRYGPEDNLNSAVNAVIQGTEADIVKAKLLYTYRERKTIGLTNLYSTVHDEINAGCVKEEGPKVQKRFKEFLNDHSHFENMFGVQINVPIIWNVDIGESWLCHK